MSVSRVSSGSITVLITRNDEFHEDCVLPRGKYIKLEPVLNLWENIFQVHIYIMRKMHNCLTG